jgi:hypothetical protein
MRSYSANQAILTKICSTTVGSTQNSAGFHPASITTTGFGNFVFHFFLFFISPWPLGPYVCGAGFSASDSLRIAFGGSWWTVTTLLVSRVVWVVVTLQLVPADSWDPLVGERCGCSKNIILCLVWGSLLIYRCGQLYRGRWVVSTCFTCFTHRLHYLSHCGWSPRSGGVC